MKRILPTTLLLCAANLGMAHAQNDKEPSRFALSCDQNSVQASIEFASASGDVTEDDMIVTFTDDGAAKKLAVKPGWFHAIGSQSAIPSVCVLQDKVRTPYPAFLLDPATLALFLVRDGRPGYPDLELALLDAKTGELLASRSLGKMKTDLPVIQPDAHGYRIRIVKEADAANCDCADAYTDTWKKVTIKNHTITSHWLETSKETAKTSSHVLER